MNHQAFSFYAGLDLGQSADYSALTIIEQSIWLDPEQRWPDGMSGWVLPSDLSPAVVSRALHDMSPLPDKPPLNVRHLERFPLGTPYPQIVERVRAMVLATRIVSRGVALCIDKTGVGAPVLDLFHAADIRAAGITITGGDKPHRVPNGWNVPKRDLVMAAVVVFQNKRLKIAGSLPDAPTLRNELQNFKVTINEKGHDSYEAWREGEHDDLVLATAMPIWYRDFRNRHLDRARMPTRQMPSIEPTIRVHDRVARALAREGLQP